MSLLRTINVFYSLVCLFSAQFTDLNCYRWVWFRSLCFSLSGRCLKNDSNRVVTVCNTPPLSLSAVYICYDNMICKTCVLVLLKSRSESCESKFGITPFLDERKCNMIVKTSVTFNAWVFFVRTKHCRAFTRTYYMSIPLFRFHSELPYLTLLVS